MKEMVTTIMKNLVDQENNLKISEVRGNFTDILEVSADKEDIGKIIGKQGKTARAIRTILKAASKKHGKKYILNIL